MVQNGLSGVNNNYLEGNEYNSTLIIENGTYPDPGMANFTMPVGKDNRSLFVIND